MRSHIGRSLEPRLRTHQMVGALSVLAGAVALWRVLSDGEPLWLVVQAGGVTFLCWAIGRELDPDRQATALLAAALVGTWAVVGLPVQLFPAAAALLAARILAETTGRRPLVTDLLFVGIFAAAVSYTPVGFVFGFVLAVSFYVDTRLSDEPDQRAVIAAGLSALGSAGVATFTGAFPQAIPPIEPALAASFVGLALLTVLREPPQPTSVVDSRRKGTFLRPDRVHAARIAVALGIVAGGLLAGDDAAAVVPMAIVLALSLASSEIERAARSRR